MAGDWAKRGDMACAGQSGRFPWGLAGLLELGGHAKHTFSSQPRAAVYHDDVWGPVVYREMRMRQMYRDREDKAWKEDAAHILDYLPGAASISP